MATEAVCTKCKSTKNVSKFNKNKTTKNGLSCWCRSCTKDYNSKKSYTKKPIVFSKERTERLLRSESSNVYKKCVKCGGISHSTNFSIDNTSSDLLQSWCRSCTAKYNTEYEKKRAKRRAELRDLSYSLVAEITDASKDSKAGSHILRISSAFISVGKKYSSQLGKLKDSEVVFMEECLSRVYKSSKELFKEKVLGQDDFERF